MSKKQNARTQKTPVWRWWVVGAAGLALVAGLALRSAVGGHKASVDASNPVAVADGGAGLASAQLAALQFPVGVEYTFELRESTRVATASGQPLAQFDLQGPLTLAAIDTSGGTTRVRGEFHGVLRTTAGVDAGDPAATMADAAQRPFLLEFASDGSFVAARAAPGTVAAVARIWSALGEYLQLVRVGASDRWEARETDASGEYLATYEVRAAGRIAKHKDRYTKLAASQLQGYSVLRSVVRFDLDERSALEAFDLEEATRTEMGSGAPLPPFEGTTTLVLRRTGARVCTDEIAAWLAQARPWSDVTHKHVDTQDRAALDRARIQGLTVREALARLQPLSRRDAGADARDRAGRAFVALAALLRQDPSALAQVRELLLKKGPLTDTLLAALRDASTPEAQKLLAEMTSASSPLDPYDRMEATRDLSLVGTPTSDTVQALKDLRSDTDLGTQATYGLGSALHKLQDEDPGLAADTRDALTSQLSGATTEGQRAAVLTAFGNAGDPTTLDLIRKYVTDPSPSVRAAAAQALRRISGPDADALLAVLCADPVPAVRESALDAISERAPSDVLVSAVTPVALGDSVYRARALAVNTLAQWLASNSAIAPTLQQVADNDPSADLRNVARHALGRG